MTAPCKDCADRTSDCHSKCERYKEYRESLEKQKAKDTEEIDTSAALRRLYFNRLKKQRSLRRKNE